MKTGLHFSVFGSSLLSAYWNGAATYYRGIFRALHARGHRITFYEPDAWGRQQNRDIEPPPWAEVAVYECHDGQSTDGAARMLERAARGSDVVVKTSGVGVLDDWLEAEVLRLRQPGRTVLFWDVDAPVTLDRMDADPNDPFRVCVPGYDLVLTYGGGQPVIDAYTRFGARACIPIYNALDPATHHPTPAEARFAADLGFLGNRLPDREARVEAFFLAAAASLPQKQFLLGGNGWADKPLSANVRYLGHVYTQDHNAFNCTPKAVLNINRASMARYGFSPPTRVFEAAGAAACLITDEWVGIEQFLAPGEEVLVARDGAAVAAYVDGLDPARARAIGQAAQRRVLAEHTYTHRAELVERALQP
jgi:spore maturation protein CgeB